MSILKASPRRDDDLWLVFPGAAEMFKYLVGLKTL